MKKLRFILCLMILICVAGTVAFLILAPEQVPMHYNAFGEIDRIGSKYENVIWPLITAVLGVIFMMIARHEQKKGERFNEKILMTIGVCTLAFFMLLGFFFMWKAMRYSPEDVKQVTAEDVNRFTSI